MLIWIAFILCTCVIVYSGTKLAKYGDIIAEKTGLGRAWYNTISLYQASTIYHVKHRRKPFLKKRFNGGCYGQFT